MYFRKACGTLTFKVKVRNQMQLQELYNYSVIATGFLFALLYASNNQYLHKNVCKLLNFYYNDA